MAKTEIINLRVDPELKNRLQNQAKKDKRSLNTMCEILLEKGVEKYEQIK